MARIFTAGNEFGDPLLEGWYCANNIWNPGVTQPGGYRSSEQNGGDYYYYIVAAYDLIHHFGVHGWPPDSVGYPVTETYSELYFRCHYYPASYVNTERAFMSFIGGNDDRFFTLTVYDPSGGTVAGNPTAFRVREDTSGTVWVTTSQIYPNDEWHMLEFHLKLGASGTGEIDVRVNGVPAGSATGTFVGPSNELSMSGISLHNTNIAGTNRDAYVDNVAVNDTTGTTNNSWPGRGYIIGRRPHRNGSTIQLLSDVPGLNNAERVTKTGNENRPFYLRTGYNTTSKHSMSLGFVKPTTLPQKDTYTIEPLPFDAGAINGISLHSEGVSNPPLSPNIRHLIVPASQAEVQGAAITPLSGGATDSSGVTHWSENPNTTAPFTVGEVDGMEIGIRFEA